MSPSHYENFMKARAKFKAEGGVYGGMHSAEHQLIMIESNKKRKGAKYKLQPGKSAGAKNSQAKFWALENESGEQFTSLSIKPWCKANGMVQASLVAKSKNNVFYKGWKVISSESI